MLLCRCDFDESPDFLGNFCIPAMHLKRLEIAGLRNLESALLPLLGEVNVLHGTNGSGKTSVLEAIHLLGLGRPLRRGRFQPVMRHESNELSVFSEAIPDADGKALPIGITRKRDGASEVRINGQSAASVSEMADFMPMQVIDSKVFDLLDRGPGERRQFMDWGVFHVEHSFREHWSRMRRCLRHRNALLRMPGQRKEEMEVWSRELAEAGEKTDACRRAWMVCFEPIFQEILMDLLPDGPGSISLAYARGWKEGISLEEALQSSLSRDRQTGYTGAGPQAADLRLYCREQPAVSILSRGQQKLVAAALRLAQGVHLFRTVGRRCLFLVDDLPAELDREHRRRFCALLEKTGSQLFVTCIEQEALEGMWTTPPRTFHVKLGQIFPEEVLKA